jgi:hypothetical protein
MAELLRYPTASVSGDDFIDGHSTKMEGEPYFVTVNLRGKMKIQGRELEEGCISTMGRRTA